MKQISKSNKKIAIIGAGPAGIAAAIQLQRAGLKPVLFEKGRVGGLLNNAFLVENYPGFPKGVRGIRLVALLRKHLINLGIKTINKEVLQIIKKKNRFIIRTSDQKFSSHLLIVASGTKPRLLDGSGNISQRVFYDIYPIRNVRNKRIAIIGGGDAAFDYALNLARCNRVKVINRSNKIRALPLLYGRLKRNRNIQYYSRTCIAKLEQLNNCLSIKLSKKGNHTVKIICDYLLVAIGREPVLGFLSPSIRKFFPKGNKKCIYFIGDVKGSKIRQTAIAVGDGVKTAMQIIMQRSR